MIYFDSSDYISYYHVAGSVIKSGEIWAGSPAKLLRTMSDDEQAFVAESAERYVHLAMVHR